MLDSIAHQRVYEVRNYYSELTKSEEWLFLIRRSPYFERFPENTKKFITELWEHKKTRFLDFSNNKIFLELLKQMGHNTVQILPSNNLADIYIEER